MEKIFPAEPGVVYPRCVTGRRDCPPEDCGGMYGFYELLQAAADWAGTYGIRPRRQARTCNSC